MKIGIVKEIKDMENRVAVTPQGVKSLAAAGHRVVVESQAGSGSGFSDREYLEAGAEIADTDAAWAADFVVKVKEPLAGEYRYLQGQLLFTFLHLAGAPRDLTEALLQSGTTAIAYETLEDAQGRLPILAPMSAIAGNMATLMGSYYLASFNQGKGVQLGTVLGEKHGKVLVIGDGTVGQHAATVACAMGAEVWMAGMDAQKGRQIKNTVLPKIQYIVSTPENIAAHLQDTDLLIGAVLRKGAKAPYVVSEAMVQCLASGSVIVDVSIDQGGCIATSKPTSHSEPVFIKYGVIHYCVTNMPGAYPRTATIALSRASLRYVQQLADSGLTCCKDDPGIRKALNVYQGYITYRPVAEAWSMEEHYRDSESLL
ncbi:MAG: alanine dehydrogenase [Gammaproteobacteria bacterium]